MEDTMITTTTATTARSSRAGASPAPVAPAGRIGRTAALGLAALAFAAYPVLRGYGPETGMEGAALYARPAWLLAHLLGMAGFVLVATGLAGVDERAGRWATWGAFLVLPYYGAEAFGLHALGAEVLATGHGDMTAAADAFRYHPVALAMFTVGWAAFAAVGIRLIVLARRAGGASRWGLALTGIALLTYLPQFFLPPAGRVSHGLLLAAGLALLALSTRRTDLA
jgi:hypothetical protein